MSDNNSFGFGNFLPGFDFLQNLTQGAANSLPQMPNMSSWVTPTVSVEELEKRITELKAVQFWLEQNSRALSATIQALEVQKMTLATLKGMNFSIADMANAFTIKTPEAPASSKKPAEAPAPAPAPAEAEAASSTAPGVIDPMQWWGALTQQFQQIAATAMTEASKAGASDLAAEAFKTATDIAAKGVQTVQEATLQAATAATAAGVAAQQAASQAAAPVKKTTARKAAPSPAPEATAGAADAEADTEPRKPPVRRTKAAR
jgi:hypothetical protein